jgi:DNA-binding transcriptional ArsR family regulator
MHDDTSTRLDTVFTLLSDADRRRLLYYLRDHGTATRTELADVLTGWRATDRPAGTATDGDRGQIESELHHRHLPALQDGELVTASLDSTIVETTDWPPWLDRCLDLAFELEATDDAEPDRPTDRSTEERN